MAQAKKKMVSNANVRLLAAHFIDGKVHKKGTVIKNYSGELSQNMKVIERPSAAEPEGDGGVGAEGNGGAGAGGGDPENGGAGSGQ